MTDKPDTTLIERLRDAATTTDSILGSLPAGWEVGPAALFREAASALEQAHREQQGDASALDHAMDIITGDRTLAPHLLLKVWQSRAKRAEAERDALRADLTDAFFAEQNRLAGELEALREALGRLVESAMTEHTIHDADEECRRAICARAAEARALLSPTREGTTK